MIIASNLMRFYLSNQKMNMKEVYLALVPRCGDIAGIRPPQTKKNGDQKFYRLVYIYLAVLGC